MNKIFKFLQKYLFLLGIIIFLFILSKTNLKEIWQNIKTIKPQFILFALLLDFPILLIKTWCWNYIKKQQKIDYPLKSSFLIYLSGMYIGSFTPGKLGELSKILYLKKDGHSTGKAAVGIFLDRISDFVFLFTFIIIGSLFFSNLIHKRILLSVLIIATLFVIFVVLLKTGVIKYLTKKIFFLIIPEKYQKSLQINFQDFINDLKSYRPKNYLIIMGITSLSWLFYYLQIFILANGANINTVPFMYFAVTITITGFITLIPISVSGVGTRDIALIALLSPFAIPLEKIIAFSTLILFAYLFTTFIGFIAWTIKPPKIIRDVN